MVEAVETFETEEDATRAVGEFQHFFLGQVTFNNVRFIPLLNSFFGLSILMRDLSMRRGKNRGKS